MIFSVLENRNVSTLKATRAPGSQKTLENSEESEAQFGFINDHLDQLNLDGFTPLDRCLYLHPDSLP